MYQFSMDYFDLMDQFNMAFYLILTYSFFKDYELFH